MSLFSREPSFRCAFFACVFKNSFHVSCVLHIYGVYLKKNTTGNLWVKVLFRVLLRTVTQEIPFRRYPRGRGGASVYKKFLAGKYLYSGIVQFSHSVMSESLQTSWTAACQVSLSVTNSWNLLKFRSIKLVMPSNHLILCRSLHLLPSIFPSIRVFSNESALSIWWPKYWSFSFSNSPSNEWIFRIDFL